MLIESTTHMRILIMRSQFWSLTALSATLLAGTATAQTGGSDDGWMGDWLNAGSWYLGAKVGGNWLADDTHIFSPSPFAPRFNGRASYDDGFIGAVQGGFFFGNGLRLEEEFSYRYNQVDHVSPYG